MNREDIEIYKKMRQDPLYWVQVMFRLIPQKKDEPFIKGKHITRQQAEILHAVKDAITNKNKRKIAIRSWHGIGKSATCSRLLLRFLFCFADCQAACTAPTSYQIHDVLRKEAKLWIDRMPEKIKNLYQRTNWYIRMSESPETRFARARTAKKEQPEALAWVHADHVLIVADEASAIPDEIYNTAEGALTGENVLVLLISNPTRVQGTFYNCFNKDKNNRQCLHYSCIDSPIVDADYVNRIAQKHWVDSDEYKIRVLGEFPSEDMVDDKWYVPLFNQNTIIYSYDWQMLGKMRLWVDPSWDGDDKTRRVVRDGTKAKVVATEKTSTAKSIAQKTLTLMTELWIDASSVYVDNFWVWANVWVELAILWHKVNCVNVWDKALDTRFLNKRAEAYRRVREWISKGWELVNKSHRENELPAIKYRRNEKGLIQIMSKKDMKKDFWLSPDCFDWLMLTFRHHDTKPRTQEKLPAHLSLLTRKKTNEPKWAVYTARRGIVYWPWST